MFEDEFDVYDDRATEAAIDAINEIRRGAYADAITTLERAFLPKWMGVSECEAAYLQADKVGVTV